MKTDYPELDGKVIDFIHINGECHQVKVIGANYHVGITAIHVNIPTAKAICLNRKIHKHKDTDTFTYRQAFHDIIRRIQSGRYEIKAARKTRNVSNIHNFGNQNCAFI